MAPIRQTALLAMSAAATTTAAADVTTYHDEAAFDAAVSTTIVVTFEEPEWDAAVGASFFGSISSGGIVFVPVSAFPTNTPNLFVAPDTQLNFCCFLDSQTLTVSGNEDVDLVFDDPPLAVGFQVFANDGEPIVYTLTLTNGVEVQITSEQEPSTDGFCGFVSDVPIARLNWLADLGEFINTGIDDVRVSGTACVGDLNGDGTVDVSDLLQLIGAWGPCGGCVADLNGDDVVDVSDMLVLLGAWGPCP